MNRTHRLIGIVLLGLGLTACRPLGVVARMEQADRSLIDCYRTFESDLQGELRLRAKGSTLFATLIATRGKLNDPAFPKMQWEGTGHRTDDRLELTLDSTAYDSVFPARVKFNASISNERVSGFLFDPALEQLSEPLTMDGCYGADRVEVRSSAD